MLRKEPSLPNHCAGIRLEREPSALHKREVREGEDIEIIGERVREAGGVSLAWQYRRFAEEIL